MTLSDFTPVGNHLWQSSIWVVAIWLLTLALKNNRAAVRYWLWMAASVKFLVPFSVLVQAGNYWAPLAVPARSGPYRVSVAVDGIGRAFALSSPAAVPVAPPATHPFAAVLLAVWLCGVAAGVVYWIRSWRRVRAAVRSGVPVDWNVAVPVLACSGRLEPGVFGICKPVLLLPEGIAEHLPPAQMEAIVAHELCHVRRRDNLTAAIHMVVETVFWFHPLVWWIRTRLIQERERACDEAVLAAATDPAVYAEGILNVCRLYASAPLVCAAGVSGANLKQRIEEIMTRRTLRDLQLGKKLMLAAAGLGAIAVPIGVGVLGEPRMLAQAQPRLAFEVASVKENKNPDPRSIQFQFLPGGKFVARNIPLMFVITAAYDLPFQSDRMTGGPDWVRGGVFDIEATAPEGAIPAGSTVKERDDRIRLMVQSLLAERFKMVIRSEVKDLPVYAAVVAKNGPKLQAAKLQEKDCSAEGAPTCHNVGGGQGRGIHGEAISISDVAKFVSNWSDRPVIDKTGLSLLYNIQTEGWKPMRPRPPRPAGQEASTEDRYFEDTSTPTLFDIFTRLGLVLQSQRAPVEMFVIESAEKPGEN